MSLVLYVFDVAAATAAIAAFAAPVVRALAHALALAFARVLAQFRPCSCAACSYCSCG
jgi:hypothetical protein